jgi:hypothetical protein
VEVNARRQLNMVGSARSLDRDPTYVYMCCRLPQPAVAGRNERLRSGIGLGTAANADWLFAITLMLQYA